ARPAGRGLARIAPLDAVERGCRLLELLLGGREGGTSGRGRLPGIRLAGHGRLERPERLAEGALGRVVAVPDEIREPPADDQHQEGAPPADLDLVLVGPAPGHGLLEARN